MGIRGGSSVQLLLVTSFLALLGSCRSLEWDPWSYECDEYGRCVKDDLSSQVSVSRRLGLQECLLTCQAYALFWPMPRTFVAEGKKIVEVDVGQVEWINSDYYDSVPAGDYLQRNIDDQLAWLVPKRPSSVEEPGPANNRLDIVINISASSRGPRATRSMSESYSLNVTHDNVDESVTAVITADNYFGARHALETLFQAVDYDEIRGTYVALVDYYIDDSPEFSHRGVSLDTSRNFMTVDTVKRIIDGLSSSKMNVLHWHMVDTHSFPIELRGSSTAQMTQYGAYDAASIYTQEDIREIVAHATYRGIRVIPEFDQPAHVGYGWNFPGAETYTVCVGVEPWYDFCVEPPCGQLNPSEPAIYDQLEAIYEELYDLFQFDIFHMGADEVHMGCWNSSLMIREYMASKGWDLTAEGYLQLWEEFQEKSSFRLKAASSEDVKLVVWTSELTHRENLHYLPPEDYIVHIWTDGSDLEDDTISALVDGGYQMVFSNYECLYLDCGYGAWVGEGNNWCSPYKGWQKMYDNDLYKLLEDRGFDATDPAIKNLVLGAESAMWSEQVDSETVEGKIFPRTAALGERLWSNPDSGWYDAETRMLEQRRRLVQRGIKADRLQPEWCRQNSGQCYVSINNPMAPATTTTTEAEGTPESEGGGGGAAATTAAAAAATTAAAALLLAAVLR